MAGSPGRTSHQRWWRAWLPAAADPAPRACSLGSGRMAVGPHRVLSRKGLWYGGSLGSPHLVGLGDYAGAGGGAVLNCGSCPGGVRPQKQQCLGGPTSSKPWQRDVHVDVFMMTTWRRKEVFLCTFGLVHILKRWCGWMMIFLFYMASETVLEELFLETFSIIENFLSHPPTVNGFSWGVLHQQVPVLVWVSSSCYQIPPLGDFLGSLASVNSLAQVGSLCQLHALYFKLE